LEILEE